MAGTIALEKFEKFAGSLYEAIIVISKRARQINEEQKSKQANDVEIDEGSDDFDDGEFDKSEIDINYTKFPKPTTLAINEMLEGKLQFEYKKNKMSR